jgi:hypothetical protein
MFQHATFDDWLVVSNPLNDGVKVSWDYYSKYMEK